MTSVIDAARERIELLASDVGDPYARADLHAANAKLLRSKRASNGARSLDVRAADDILADLESRFDGARRHQLREARQLVVAVQEEWS